MRVKSHLDAQWYESKKSYYHCSELVFSKETYQLVIKDTLQDKDFVVFLQFETEDALSDAFCSCDQEEELCKHVLFSLNTIFNSFPDPLHIRFESSFYHALFQSLAFNHGFFPHVQLHNGIFGIENRDQEVFFSLQSNRQQDEKTLSLLLIDREKENESNSLKFSKLSSEELRLYRSGRPSKALSYELSLWSDVAKFLFLKQEQGQKPHIHFEERPEALPSKLSLKLGFVELYLDLQEDNLLDIIPYLRGIDSNLKVYCPKQAPLKGIYYQEQNRSFKLAYEASHEGMESLDRKDPTHSIGRWFYVAGKGFYDQEGIEKPQQTHIPEGAIATFLDENTSLIKKHLQDYTLKRQEKALHYEVQFDKNWNLQVSSYLFEKGDLDLPSSALFGQWVFIEQKGFFKVRNLKAEVMGKTPCSDVESFLDKHRLWLGQFSGFAFHLSSFETSLDYSFDMEKGLSFRFFSYGGEEEKKHVKDFGRWIYFENQGFFSKQSKNSLHLLSGKQISLPEVASFIIEKQELLVELPHFFIDENPLKQLGLKVFIKNDTLQVRPFHRSFSKWGSDEIFLLGPIAYVKDKGFYILPKKDHIQPEILKGMSIPKSHWDHFFAHEWERIYPHVIYLSPELTPTKDLALQLEHFEKLSKGGLKVDMQLVSSLGQVPIDELLKAHHHKKRFLPTDAGLLDLRHPMLRAITALKGDGHNLSYFDFFKLMAQSKIELSPRISKQSENAFKGLFEFQEESNLDLSLLKGELRPYQRYGVDWLWFLFQNQLSGLLCDDMGLGKTHQVMALIAAIIHQKPTAKFLVVCPTSVLYHWRGKLQDYLPHLKLCFYHGSKRNSQDIKSSCSLFLTSYGICRQEKELFIETGFDVAIYDEIQVAKNHHSRIYKSLVQLPAVFKLGLTGTPIENTLRELKSVFDLVLPGYLPGEAEFKRQFVEPIEKQQDKEQVRKLHRLVGPFILRRKKEEVLSDLPSKVEENLLCSLSKDQYTLYNQLVNSYKNGLMKELQDDTKPVSYIHVFSLLTKLKQICDHPSVFLGDPDAYRKYQSGKFEAFVDLLQQARLSGQKVVVFSQYLGMLDIMQKYLEEHHITYSQVRGSTFDREKQIERFNQREECEVFLASLQAAGVGIDLTAASCVIHYDRWWNPARENQATDRVHRIGQTKGVQVFKMITKGSLEERIDRLIERKNRLITDLIQSSEEAILKTLTKSELIELLDTANKED